MTGLFRWLKKMDSIHELFDRILEQSVRGGRALASGM